MTRDERKAQALARYQQVWQWKAEGKRIKEIQKLAGDISEARVFQILQLRPKETIEISH